MYVHLSVHLFSYCFRVMTFVGFRLFLKEFIIVFQLTNYPLIKNFSNSLAWRIWALLIILISLCISVVLKLFQGVLLSSLGMYISLLSIVLSLKIPAYNLRSIFYVSLLEKWLFSLGALKKGAFLSVRQLGSQYVYIWKEIQIPRTLTCVCVCVCMIM